MRTIIIGDVHGCLDELLTLVRQTRRDPDDRIVLVAPGVADTETNPTDGQPLQVVLPPPYLAAAVAGKLSVATFPAVFLAHDFFIERRPLKRSLLDKVPFLVAAALPR